MKKKNSLNLNSQQKKIFEGEIIQKLHFQNWFKEKIQKIGLFLS